MWFALSIIFQTIRNLLKQFFSAQWGSAPTSSVTGHANRVTGHFFLYSSHTAAAALSESPAGSAQHS